MKIKRNKIVRFDANDNGNRFTVHFIPLGKTCPGYTHKVMVQAKDLWHLAGWLATGYAVNCKHAKFFLEKFQTERREQKREQTLTIAEAIMASQPPPTLQLAVRLESSLSSPCEKCTVAGFRRLLKWMDNELKPNFQPSTK